MGAVFELLNLMWSIYEYRPDKPPRVKREVIWFVIIFFVSTISFALGYLAGRDLNHPPIIIETSGTLQ